MEPLDAAVRAIVARMVGPDTAGRPGSVIDIAPWLTSDAMEQDPIGAVTAAFLAGAAGGPGFATDPLHDSTPAPVQALAAFYRDGLHRVDVELARVAREDPQVAARVIDAAARLETAASEAEAREATWQAWFPQGTGIIGHEDARIAALREARTVTVTQPSTTPIVDPAAEVLFTSNVLLTIPSATSDPGTWPYADDLRQAILAAAAEPQRYWFDHPIQIGVEPAANELLYGLQELDAAVGLEHAHRPEALGPAPRVTCLLSVSVTHDGLAGVARRYVEAELARSGGLQHIDVVIVTEPDAQDLVDEVFAPALALTDETAEPDPTVAGMRAVFGVDGEYGRHYSFLKAIAAVWQVTIDARVRATFKIDLDQVFPEVELLAETGRTAFGLLADPLWGARGLDAEGRQIELGMIAGALVNERDIGRGLFTPDVALPEREPRADERLFWTALPQAISTRAEMMERYDGPRDGAQAALERVHVTGGTNGIRMDALRRHRPFTPTFIGRAEDQAYLLSTLGRPGPRLAYAHAAGLIMRHDKEAFAAEAIAAAHVGKLLGDDIRILVFSAYADAAAGDGTDGSLDRDGIRRLIDPFTGAFVSDLPVSLVHLRFALRTLGMLASGATDAAREYANDGARRLEAALTLAADRAAVRARVDAERQAWGGIFDALDALEAGLAAGDERASRLRSRAVGIIDACRIDGQGQASRAG